MDITEAKYLAYTIRKELEHYFTRLEVAGSIRRNKPEVKDIELIGVPKLEHHLNLLGEKFAIRSLIDEYDWSDLGKPIKNGSRYKQIETKYGINLDLFIIFPPSEWGVQFVIRTGPASFSRRVVTQRHKGGLLPSDCKVKDGAVYRYGELVPTPEEEDFFNLLEIDYINPSRR
jgi:DNA polymerase/3'-5' exonuclease PolX